MTEDTTRLKAKLWVRLNDANYKTVIKHSTISNSIPQIIPVIFSNSIGEEIVMYASFNPVVPKQRPIPFDRLTFWQKIRTCVANKNIYYEYER